jgi:molybdopterin-guanine dinucleotide biosynthesis protein MobB
LATPIKHEEWRLGYREVSLALLAGGSSTRMGTDKTAVDFENGTLLERMLALASGVFRDVFVVTREPSRLRDLEVPVVRDAVDVRGSAVGIYTALLASPTERVLCLACDMPLMSTEFLRCLAEGSAGHDALVPRHGGLLEPLCAVYNRRAAPAFELILSEGDPRIDRVYPLIDTGYLEVDESRFGSARELFMNTNTPEDLDRARERARGRAERRSLFPTSQIRRFRSRSPVPVVSFVGKKKSGKTTVLLGVVRELVARGHRVAALKHDTHGFDIDLPGTDSYRLREAGAVVAGISSPDKYVWVNQTAEEAALGQLVARITEPVDLLITEGFKRQDAPKIEVSRRERSTGLVCAEDELLAIVSDQAFPTYRVPQLAMDDFVAIADLVEREVLGRCGPVRAAAPAVASERAAVPGCTKAAAPASPEPA